ncbi:MAG TPA: hypothetical protein ENF48_01110 [Desulfobacteraceae bacterium]|nr:hypothetical protein [Desulfobacteraceae bacterium]
MKRKLVAVVVVTLVGFFLAAGGVLATSLSERYYQRHPLKASELEKTWGKPVLTETLDNGLERRVYEIAKPYPETMRYRFFIIRDGMVVSSGISDQKGGRADIKPSQSGELPAGRLSQSYYAKFPLSAEEVEKTWGAAVQVKDLGDGLETRVYEIRNPYPANLKYRYFLIQDGRVLASGVTDIIGTQEKADTCGVTGPPVGRLSKLYYQRYSLTVDEVEKVWGKPIAVQKIDNGMENRVYEIPNPYPADMKYRYFLSKDGKVVASGISETVICDIGIN